MKKLLLTALLFISIYSKAQDVIYKNDKSELKAKVLEISDTEIKYKKFDFQDGPTYSIKKDQVFIIVYQNGQKEIIESPKPQVATKPTKPTKPVKTALDGNKKSLLAAVDVDKSANDRANLEAEIRAKIEQEQIDKAEKEKTRLEAERLSKEKAEKELTEKEARKLEKEQKEKERKEKAALKEKEEKEKELQELRDKIQQKEKELGITPTKSESPKTTILGEDKTSTTILNNNKKEVTNEKQTANIETENTNSANSANKPRVQKNSDEVDINYDRSSLYSMMITDPSRNYEDEIKNYFESKLVPDKYNDHNLDKRFITTSYNKKNQLDNVVAYLEADKVAHKLIAKWFNRSAKGGFSMDLIKKRGYYDASAVEINQAKGAANGKDLLFSPKVVKNLIDNTFILVIDSKYTNKEDVAAVGKSAMSIFGQLTGTSSLVSSTVNLGLDTFGKGFMVSTNAYLFKLVWDEEIDARFWSEIWCTDKDVTPEKRAAFDNATFFALEYIGTQKSSADVQSTNMTTKTNGELIGRATVKSINNVITHLQQDYDVFKTKTPIFSAEPLTAKIGLKEGLTSKTKFEVLEQQLTDEGTLEFVQVGTVKVDSKYPIWDNRFGADEENPNQGIDKTYFKATSGRDFAPGMLLRQIK